MSQKNDIPVVINNKVYTLSGFESEEYLQKVAAYINGKLSEFNADDAYRRQSAEYRANLMYLNIADDYFKAKNMGESLQTEIDNKDKQINDLKHELITSQIKIEALNKERTELKGQISTYQKSIAKLEEQLDKTDK